MPGASLIVAPLDTTGWVHLARLKRHGVENSKGANQLTEDIPEIFRA
jgi:hypothetical protein